MHDTHLRSAVEKLTAQLEVLAARVAMLEGKMENTANVEEMTALVQAAVSDE